MAARKRKGSNVGISINERTLQVTQFNPKGFQLNASATFDIPAGLLNQEQVLDPQGLGDFIKAALSSLKIKSANLVLPATLLRLVEMPKLEPKDLYMSLSSEAERYKAFDNTEAVVDFEALPPLESTAATVQRVIFGAIRKDTFDIYRQIFSQCKIKLEAIDLEPFCVLRSMAGSGVLDSLIQQIGETAVWGALFMSPERTHVTLWRANQLIEFREVNLTAMGLEHEPADSPIMEDLIEEVDRTVTVNKPVVWLTHQTPPNAAEAIGQHFNIPVRPCMLGPNLSIDDESILLQTAGAAMYPTIFYPFDINFLTDAAPVSTPAGNTKATPSQDDNNPVAGLLIGAALACCLILGVIAGGLFLYDSLIVSNQLNDANKKHSQMTTQIASLQQQVQILKDKYELRAAIIDVIENAKYRNALYTHFSNDLKSLTPGRVWLYNVEIDDRITMEGKALQHQPVVDFARKLDNITYSKQVLFDEIQEELNNTQRIFKFKISGQPFLSKDLVDKGASSALEEIDDSMEAN